MASDQDKQVIADIFGVQIEQLAAGHPIRDFVAGQEVLQRQFVADMLTSETAGPRKKVEGKGSRFTVVDDIDL